MDSLLVASQEVQSYQSVSLSISTPQTQIDFQAIQSLSINDDAAVVSLDDIYAGLTLTAHKVIEKLNELLKNDLPHGIQSLKPEDHTPERTADRIVSGVTGLFSVYSKRHPDLEGEELVAGFMDTIRSGVQSGYDDAYGILEGIGAFDIDGVRAGVEKTKILIEQKLAEFEKQLRVKLGVDPASEPQLDRQVSQEVLKQGGRNVLDITA